MSEVSDIDRTIYQEYAERGLTVYAISSEEEDEVVRDFSEALGLTMPVLLDRDGAAIEDYRRYVALDEWASAYPQQWFIDSEGTIRYFTNHFEPDVLTALIEEALTDRR